MSALEKPKGAHNHLSEQEDIYLVDALKALTPEQRRTTYARLAVFMTERLAFDVTLANVKERCLKLGIKLQRPHDTYVGPKKKKPHLQLAYSGGESSHQKKQGSDPMLPTRAEFKDLKQKVEALELQLQERDIELSQRDALIDSLLVWVHHPEAPEPQ